MEQVHSREDDGLSPIVSVLMVLALLMAFAFAGHIDREDELKYQRHMEEVGWPTGD